MIFNKKIAVAIIIAAMVIIVLIYGVVIKMQESQTNKLLDQKILDNRDATGSLKSINPSGSQMVVSSGKDYRAVITPATEIFRDGKRSLLADIKETDAITVLGRQKTPESADFVADSIYANSGDDNTPVQF
jgi:hypothetical protein